MDPTIAFLGAALTWTAGDLSGVIASGSTNAILRWKNTSDVPITLHYRKTGSTDDAKLEILPQLYSSDTTISLTVARTVEYYIEGGGSVQCEVVHYWGTGLTAVQATTYTTAAKVASQLRLINSSQARLTFDGTTDPTLTEVEDFILESEDDIDRDTNHAWRAVTVADEYHDVNGLYTGEYRSELPVKLAHRKIRTLVSGTDKIEIWDGTNWKDLVLAANGYTEGRANDYWLDYTNGIVYFASTKPYYSERGVRVTYRFGDTTVSKDIQEACTKLAAIKIAEDDDYKARLPEGTNQYAVASKVETWRKDVARILGNHRGILLTR